MNNLILEKLKLLPHKPGCYLYFNSEGKVIYVGKAKDLFKRVHQYFLANRDLKTQALVSNINNLEYITTNSEVEALILENNLIKKHEPFYNIKLTDGKTYPYIVITNEEHPRVLLVRKLIYSNIKYYYGPFTNQSLARYLVDLFNNIYPFRKCYKIPKDKCLYYDLGLCLGPCIKKEKIDYSEYISEINDLFQGRNILQIKEKLTSKLYYYKDSLNYEEAKKIKLILEQFSLITAKQIINLDPEKNGDYLAYTYNEELISIFILKMREGVIKDHFRYVSKYLLDPIQEINQVLNDYYLHSPFNNQIYSLDNTLVLPKEYTIPKIGNNLKLLELAKNNAQKALLDHMSINKHKLLQSLELKENLIKIFKKELQVVDALDIAQLFGTNILGGVIRLKDSLVINNLSRFYHLDESILGDVNLIYELALKHYLKVSEYPDLIFTDGAKLQVEYLKKALAKLNLDIPVCGLAKDKNHNLEYIYYDDKVIALDKHSVIYSYLRFIDESIHNYIIKKHQNLRIKSSFKSKLEAIPGVGLKTANKLLTKYSSYDEIKNASIEELKTLSISENVIKKIKERL